MSYGVVCNADRLTHAEIQAFARRAEEAGVDTVWVPELFGRDPFITSQSMLAATSSIRVGTAIANLYARDARATKSAAYSLAEGYANRFELGLGLSNRVANEMRGHDWISPLAKVRDYIEAYETADIRFEHGAVVPTYLAAHGPALMAFVAEHLDGAFSYLQPTSYTSEARKILGSKKLHVLQTTVFAEQPDRARDVARRAVSMYMSLENYRRAWQERGFDQADFAGAGSDAFIDSIAAWGDEGRILERYDEQFEKGADHLIILPINLDLRREEHWGAVRRLVARSI